MQNKLRNTVALLSLLLLCSCPPTIASQPTEKTTLDGALKLEIASVNWYKDDNTSSFVQFIFNIDIIVNNTSSENITITFWDGDKWRSSIESEPINESLVIVQSTFFYIMVLMEATFVPGITHMTDFVGVDVYDPTREVLPDGEYSITVGEYYSKQYPEIEGPVTKTFYVYNFYSTLTPPFETSYSIFGVIVSLIISQIVVIKIRRKRKR